MVQKLIRFSYFKVHKEKSWRMYISRELVTCKYFMAHLCSCNNKLDCQYKYCSHCFSWWILLWIINLTILIFVHFLEANAYLTIVRLVLISANNMSWLKLPELWKIIQYNDSFMLQSIVELLINNNQTHCNTC